VFTSFLSAVSQIMLNISARKEHKGRLYEYLNTWVICSYAILAFTLIFNVWVMKYVPLKEANAITASAYVFVMILSKLILGEKITIKKILANVLIIFGIIVFML
jgi:drug/metabolite transporter (DMT)-like permease